MASMRCYRAGVLIDESRSLAKLDEHLSDEHTIVWVDLYQPTLVELQSVGDELGLHSLAVEDATTERQRPKLDHYEHHDFLSAYAVLLDDVTGELITAEIAAFITQKALITVRKDAHFPIDALFDHLDQSADLTTHGIGALLYNLLDFVVDGHFDTVQALDDQIESLEDVLFDHRPQDVDVQRRSFQLRKSLVRLRRVVLPMREVVNTLMRRDTDLVPAAMAPFYQDLYNHVLRATEWTDSLRDLVSTIVETNLTVQGNRLNVITKKVTSWAAIIAVPTAVTGFYGQNLPYPGFASPAGFITSTVVIIVLSVALFITFKHNDWL